MPLRFLPAADPAAEALRRERLLDERAAKLARRRDGVAAEPAGLPVLLCDVGGELFGLALNRVAEVLPPATITPLPGTPPAVLGLIGRMGHFFCVVDLGVALLRQPPAGLTAEAGGHLLMLRRVEGSQERRLALRVTRALRVERVVPLADAAPLEAPLRFRGTVPDAAGLPPALVSVLDDARLLDFPHASSLPGA
ncbi:chemotaxis protein CheW [Roseomonas elaeocarpi]|uniref:Chemotaxis protein CheW n=1 Tax=Roseomonas elaeocarpi TaxID=907779 RepID=A0ABV6JSY6_9PROT